MCGFTCWNLVFLCLGRDSLKLPASSSSVGPRLAREPWQPGRCCPGPMRDGCRGWHRLPREPASEGLVCARLCREELLLHSALSPEVLFFTPERTLLSSGFTYKLESLSRVISPSEGKGCVRHDANVSAMQVVSYIYCEHVHGRGLD